MKKTIFAIFILVLTFAACSANNIDNQSTTIIETTKSLESKESNNNNNDTRIENKSQEIYTRQNNRASFSFDPNKKFVYTGNEKYLKEVTDVMLKEFGSHFEQTNNVEIPTPYIVKIDDDDKNDIKVFGDFYIYGYTMNGMIFDCVNGGSFPGCIHLKEDGKEISVLSIEIAEDGSKYNESLLKICEGDESLKRDIDNVRFDDGDILRIDYVKMYMKDNNLKVSGIKDYGWPVILFSDISNANFVYNFYNAYLDEYRQDNVLNDFDERLTNLKKKYLSDTLISKVEDEVLNMDCDPIIGAQDVTDTMLDTLLVEDIGDEKVAVSIDIGDNRFYTVDVKIDTINNKKRIVDMNFLYS